MTASFPPADASPFVETDDGLLCTLPGAQVWFTGRGGGTSRGPYGTLNLGTWTADDPATVHANRVRVAEGAGLPVDRLAQARQVHGTEVLTVRGSADLPRADLSDAREADGVATALPDVACAVLCADCLPVALVANGAVAMVHAGWRGLSAGVLESGLEALRAVGGRGAVTALVGPGAGPCCYETGPEVHAAFASLGPGVSRGTHVDLPEAATRRLRAAGVGTVHRAGRCTICAPERYFSHRRDAGITGRQAGVAWLR